MAEITPNPYKEEIDKFKEDVLKSLHDLESRLNSQISNKELSFKKNYDEFTSKMNTLIENNKEIVTNLVMQKLKLEKISELESFKNKVDGMLITHEVRIKNNIDEISKIKTKYDKIISENLFVSGFIGNSCQFKNVSEYLSYNISEVSKLKMEKDQLKKDLKDLKGKIEGLMKNMITLNDNSVKLCNKYTDNKQEEFRKMLESGQNEMNSKSLEMRTMIVKFTNEVDHKMTDLKTEFNKVLEIKKDVINIVDEKYENFQIQCEDLNKKFIKTKEDFESNNKRWDNSDEQFKNLDQNIKDLSFKVRNYYCVSNKIATLLERLRSNPSKNELTKLILDSQKNNEISQNISASPQPKRYNRNVNFDLMKFTLDDTGSIKNTNNTNDINSPEKKKMANQFQKIGLKTFEGKDFHSDSEKSSIIESEHYNKLEEKLTKEKGVQKEKSKENIKEDAKDNAKENIKENNKEDLNIKRPLLSSQKHLQKIPKNNSNTNNNNQLKILPIVKNGNKDEFNIERNKMKKGKLQKNMVKQLNLEFGQDNRTCNVINLNMPLNQFSNSSLGIPNKVNGLNEKGKYDVVNTLINDYRAKMFSKAHSPRAKAEMNNEILDIPKKITQAFGRTTYNFYFKKDAIDILLANKNINNFGFNGPKRNYNYKNNNNNKNNKRIDTVNYKLNRNDIQKGKNKMLDYLINNVEYIYTILNILFQSINAF